MRVPRLNWDEQFARLQPYIGPGGGRVCITGHPSSGLQWFAKFARQEIMRLEPSAACVKIDPHDPATHFEFDIIAKVAAKLGVQESVGVTTAASGNLAGNDVIISDNTFVFGDTPPWDEARELRQRTRGLIDAVREQASLRRVVFFLHSCDLMSYRTADWFWGEFWGEDDGGIRGLVSKGVALVCCCHSDGECKHGEMVPDDATRMRLPQQYAGVHRERALVQAAELIDAAHGVGQQEAIGSAKALFWQWQNKPSLIYSGLPGYLETEWEG